MESPRQSLIQRLRGQEYILPDLTSLFPAWTPRVNPNYEAAKHHCDNWVLHSITDQNLARQVVSGNYSFMAATFYPDADSERILTAAEFIAWVIAYDDELDQGSLLNDYSGSTQYVSNMIACAEACLGRSFPAISDPAPDFGWSTINCFYNIGRKIKQCSNDESTARFKSALISDLKCLLPMREYHERGEIPSQEMYWKYRQGTSGARMSAAFIEYANNFELPSSIAKHMELDSLVRCTNLMLSLLVLFPCVRIDSLTKRMVALTNVFSIRNELRNGHIDNIVTLAVHNQDLSLQAAVDYTINLAKEQYAAFQEHEKSLFSLASDPEEESAIGKFVQGCKDICVGNVHLSYTLKRYTNSREKVEGNVHKFIL